MSTVNAIVTLSVSNVLCGQHSCTGNNKLFLIMSDRYYRDEHADKWLPDYSEEPVEDEKGGVQRLLCTLWSACSWWLCDIAPWTIFSMSLAGCLQQIIISLNLRQTDLPRPPNIPAPVPSDQQHPEESKTNSPLGSYGPSYGPPSLARHGGGTSDSALTRWI